MHESLAAPIAPLTTIRVGGPADRLVVAESTDDLVDAVREVGESRLEDRVEHGQRGPAVAERLRDHHIEIRAGKPAHSFGEEHYPPPTNCTSSTVSPSSRRTEV